MAETMKLIELIERLVRVAANNNGELKVWFEDDEYAHRVTGVTVDPEDGTVTLTNMEE